MADNDPKIATQRQWEDLANKVQSKATVLMTTTDPGEGSALEENHFIGVYGGDPIIMDYSTSEVSTGYRWIDGSLIYKKTISWGAMPNNTRENRDSQYPNDATIIKIDAIALSTSNGAAHSMPYVSADGGTFDTAFAADASTGRLSVATNTDRRTWNAYITIYYVKSS